MNELWITNASPIIALAGIGLQDLLVKLPARLEIPESVVREVLAGIQGDPARALLEGGWGNRVEDPSIPGVVQSWGLGTGESSVIALGCARPTADLILDDAPARRCARSLGLKVRGTVGVLLLAKRRSLIPVLRDALTTLRQRGFFVDNELFEEALKLAGEA